MDDPGNQFLTSAALALDQHGSIAFHYPADGLVHFLHRRAATDDLLVAAVHGEQGLIQLRGQASCFQSPRR